MYKRCLLALVAAGLLSVGTSLATAQENPPSDQPSMQEHGHMGGHGYDPAQRTQELTKKLKLNSDQQTKVQDVLTSEKSQMQSLRQDTSMSQQDRRSKMMDIHKTSNDQIRAVLNSDQQKKWDEMQAKREEHMQNHKGGMDKGQDNPPQQ